MMRNSGEVGVCSIKDRIKSRGTAAASQKTDPLEQSRKSGCRQSSHSGEKDSSVGN